MSPPADPNLPKSLLEKALSGNPTIELLQKFIAVVGIVGTAWQAIIKETTGAIIAAAIVGGTLLWFWGARWWQRKHRSRIASITVPESPKAYLRGLLPFERGESLLGRKNDLDLLLTIVDRQEFRFGFVSGEAGAGKTSFLRAGLIPKLEAAGWLVVYVPRPGTNPHLATRKELSRCIKNGQSAEVLVDLVRIITTGTTGRLILICDQFEQSFLTYRTTESRRPFIEELAACCQDETLPFGLLLSLRKEFVDDLQDFESYIPQFIDRRNKHRLRNWDATTAIEVLKAAALHDAAPFSEELIETIIADLAQDGVVRPVELQVVATRLHEQRIYEMGRYVKCGRSRGILTAYVREFIEPDGDKTLELEKQTARHLLRALCSGSRDARRPTGLTATELETEVTESLRQSGQSVLVANTSVFEDTLQRLLRSGLEQYLFVMEDENRVNLAHDYIVGPIRDATADVSSLEEQANRMLDQHLEYARLQRRASIPWKQLRFISRHASRSRVSALAAASLLRRSKTTLLLKMSLGLIAVLAIITLLLPHGVHITQRELPGAAGGWALAADRKATLNIAQGIKGALWLLDTPWEQRIRLPVPFRAARLSPKSTYLAGVNVSGELYLWPTSKIPTSNIKPTLTGMKRGGMWDNFSIGFSADERWFMAASADGKCYLSNPAQPIPSDLVPFIKLPEHKKEEAEGDQGNKLVLPRWRFSPAGNFVIVLEMVSDLDDTGVARIFSLPIKENPDGIELGEISPTVVWSPSGNWLAATDKGGDLVIWQLSSLNKNSREPKYRVHFKESKDPDFDSIESLVGAFSPNERWLVMRYDRGNFYNLDLQNWPSEFIPINDVPQSGGGSMDPIFSPNSAFVTGLGRDGSLYMWSPESNGASNAVKPIMRSAQSQSFERLSSNAAFSPKGTFVVASDNSGSVSIWRTANIQRTPEPCATHGSGNVRFIFSADENHLFTYGGFDLFFGRVDGPLQLILRYSSPITHVSLSGSRRDLIVMALDHAVTLQRKYFIWGIPVKTLIWPELARKRVETEYID